MLRARRWVLDGGMGSTLEEEGHGTDGDPLWSARLLHENPTAIKQVHRSFLHAGAKILTTASYQASVPGFRQHLGVSEGRALGLIMLSVTLAREAIEEFRAESGIRGQEPLIAGSVGPYGACLADGSEYTGSYMANTSPLKLLEWHRPRVKALLEAGVDLLAIESFPALEEAEVVLRLVKEFPNARAWVTFSCKDGSHTNYGDNFGSAVRRCYEVGGPDQLVGVGVNCSPPPCISLLLREANKTLPPPSDLPRVVYPNSGEQWVHGKGWEGERAQEVLTEDLLREWAGLGATVIGGCCRMGPKAVRNIDNIVYKLPTNLKPFLSAVNYADGYMGN